MKTVILGFDAFDPAIFERLFEQGRLPHLGKAVEAGGYARFQVSDPPQSEVSWTSIASGLNPGEHGLFDFVHRDPATYQPYISLLPTRKSMAGIQFVPPSSVPTIFDQAVDQGYPAVRMWWPATFPARPESPVHSIPGLGTPDIHGRLGIGVFYTSDPDAPSPMGKTPVLTLQQAGPDHFTQRLQGPARRKRSGQQETEAALEIRIENEELARLQIGRSVIELAPGRWSPIVEVNFRLGPLLNIRALTRIILTQLSPHVSFYVLPLQLHPLHSPWRYGAPGGFVKRIWKDCGPFLTLGWPQDTIGLEDGCITDGQFLDLCDSIFESRSRALMHELGRFREGLLATVFDSLDRIQHMFWRSDPETIERWYLRLDALVGKVAARLQSPELRDSRLVVVSDHGFNDFNYKVHVNRWLMENGLLAAGHGTGRGLNEVDWSHTQAYALGLNSLYLNLEGREGQGSVKPGDRNAVLLAIQERLAGWRGPDGRPVLADLSTGLDAFQGPLASRGPDLVLGFAPGYRASQQTGLGGWDAAAIEPNNDHWTGDHCMAAGEVPGVIFSNQGLAGFPAPSYQNFPAIAIDSTPESGPTQSPPELSDEESAIIEERLRSLGYL